MQKYTNAQYNKVFYKLPREIQDAVASSKTTEMIRKVAEKHRLQLDTTDNLINIVLDVLMGIIASKDIVSEVVENCAVSRPEAILIVKDLDDDVFKPVKELMMKLYNEGAPFKPATLKTVDEKDEDHIHLDPNQILKEIEDPVGHEVKKEPVPPNPELQVSTEKNMSEYHTEISLGKTIATPVQEKAPDFRSAAPTGITNIEESKKRLLNSIASQKLSSVFTMPKTSNETPMEKKENLGKNLATDVPTSQKTTNKIDPYREQF